MSTAETTLEVLDRLADAIDEALEPLSAKDKAGVVSILMVHLDMLRSGLAIPPRPDVG